MRMNDAWTYKEKNETKIKQKWNRQTECVKETDKEREIKIDIVTETERNNKSVKDR